MAFSQGSPLKIGDDLRLARPTFLAAVPALFDRIRDKIIAGAKAKGGLKAAAFSKALASKLKALAEGKPLTTSTLSDRLVFKPLKERLGLDRVIIMCSGAAPLRADTKMFFFAMTS